MSDLSDANEALAQVKRSAERLRRYVAPVHKTRADTELSVHNAYLETAIAAIQRRITSSDP